MEKIKIATTQNVDIEYYLPDIGTRVMAAILDLLIMGAYLAIAFLSLGLIGDDLLTRGTITLLMVPVGLYHLLFEQFNQGQSPGKKWMGVRVVKLDGSQPGLGDYLLRWIMRPLETNVGVFYGLVGIISISFSGKGQRLGDLLAGTTVVSLKQDVSLRDTIFTWNPEGYQPRFPQVRNLNRRDISIIKDILMHYDKQEKKALLVEAEQKVASVMGVKPEGLTAQQFLRVVVMDYTHFMSS